MNRIKAIIISAVVLAICIILAACAPTVVSSNDASSDSGDTTSTAAASADSGDATTTAAASAGGECAICHEEEAASMADASLIAAAHAFNDCATCHTDEAIASIHEGVSAPPDEDQLKALRKKGRTMGTSEFCTQCHSSLEELAERTAEVTTVQDTAGNITNPHAIPVNDKHTEAGVQECYNCHWLHRSSPAATSNCNSCHHSGVHECGTCHEVRD